MEATITKTFRLSKEVVTKLQKLADKDDRSMNYVVEKVLCEALKKVK